MLRKGRNKEFSQGELGANKSGLYTGNMFTPSSPPVNRMNLEKMSAAEAYEIVHAESYFDSNTKLNMATFVSTWMESTAIKLMEENLDKNFIDKLIYPQTVEMERYCISMLSDLFHAGKDDDPVGTSTIGFTEAALLDGQFGETLRM